MTTTSSTQKPGINTTEFWISTVFVPILVPIIMVLVNKYGIPLSEEAVTAVVIAAVSSPITYILGRIHNKKKIADTEQKTVQVELLNKEIQKLKLESKNAKV